MMQSACAKPLAICLIILLILVSSGAGPADAMFVRTVSPDARSSSIAGRSADIAVIQKALELKMIRERLVDYGLTKEQALERIGNLSDDRLHEIAANIKAVQPGGNMHGEGLLDGRHPYGYYWPWEALVLVLVLLLLFVIIAQQDAPMRA